MNLKQWLNNLVNFLQKTTDFINIVVLFFPLNFFLLQRETNYISLYWSKSFPQIDKVSKLFHILKTFPIPLLSKPKPIYSWFFSMLFTTSDEPLRPDFVSGKSFSSLSLVHNIIIWWVFKDKKLLISFCRSTTTKGGSSRFHLFLSLVRVAILLGFQVFSLYFLIFI